METWINYYNTNSVIADAWFKYKKTHPSVKLSVRDFVAGYNAALATLDTNRGYQPST